MLVLPAPIGPVSALIHVAHSRVLANDRFTPLCLPLCGQMMSQIMTNSSSCPRKRLFPFPLGEIQVPTTRPTTRPWLLRSKNANTNGRSRFGTAVNEAFHSVLTEFHLARSPAWTTTCIDMERWTLLSHPSNAIQARSAHLKCLENSPSAAD